MIIVIASRQEEPGDHRIRRCDRTVEARTISHSCPIDRKREAGKSTSPSVHLQKTREAVEGCSKRKGCQPQPTSDIGVVGYFTVPLGPHAVGDAHIQVCPTRRSTFGKKDGATLCRFPCASALRHCCCWFKGTSNRQVLSRHQTTSH